MPSPRLHRRELLLGAGAFAGAMLLGSCTDGDGSSARFRIEQIPYGDAPQQAADLYLPIGTEHRGVITLVHGGYWTVGLTRVAMTPLAEELVRIGYVVWNLGYRRVGDQGGGWPGTFEDVAAGVDALTPAAQRHGFELDRHAILGHSAGGQLAFWAGARHLLPAGAPGAEPAVRPTALVSLSGVLDLRSAAELPAVGRLGDLRRAVERLLGGTPTEVPERYALTCPTQLAPMGVPQLLMHGTVDDIVPVQLTESYAAAASDAGDQVTLTLVDGVDHFDTVQATPVWWSAVLDWLPRHLPER